MEHLGTIREFTASNVPAFTKWSDSDMNELKICNVSANLSSDPLDKELPEEDNDLMANRIIKMVCEDINREFMYEEESTPEVISQNF